jgi:TRAP-type mannitol/chloroaromatic compound transport system permease small subunit
MMKFFIKFADTLSTSMGKAFSWCIVILMGGTVYEVVMAYVFNAPLYGILILVCKCMVQFNDVRCLLLGNRSTC